MGFVLFKTCLVYDAFREPRKINSADIRTFSDKLKMSINSFLNHTAKLYILVSNLINHMVTNY